MLSSRSRHEAECSLGVAHGVLENDDVIFEYFTKPLGAMREMATSDEWE